MKSEAPMAGLSTFEDRATMLCHQDYQYADLSFGSSTCKYSDLDGRGSTGGCATAASPTGPFVQFYEDVGKYDINADGNPVTIHMEQRVVRNELVNGSSQLKTGSHKYGYAANEECGGECRPGCGAGKGPSKGDSFYCYKNAANNGINGNFGQFNIAGQGPLGESCTGTDGKKRSSASGSAVLMKFTFYTKRFAECYAVGSDTRKAGCDPVELGQFYFTVADVDQNAPRNTTHQMAREDGTESVLVFNPTAVFLHKKYSSDYGLSAETVDSTGGAQKSIRFASERTDCVVPWAGAMVGKAMCGHKYDNPSTRRRSSHRRQMMVLWRRPNCRRRIR